MSNLIKTFTDGIVWGMMVTCMLSVIVLVATGTIRLIEGPEMADLLLFVGAYFALFINLSINTENK